MHLPFMSGYASGIVLSYHTSDGTVKLPSFSYQQSTAASSVVKFMKYSYHDITYVFLPSDLGPNSLS